MKSIDMPRVSGFTLMESVVALLVLCMVSVAIISLNGNLFLRSRDAHDLQQGTQLLQACIDQVLSIRRTSGYAATLHCNEVNALVPGITLSVNPNATVEYCPTGLQCKEVQITLNRNGTSSAPTSLLLVNY
jgi:prepilin-type N-terminal cleavage/methylation domain-containing protein